MIKHKEPEYVEPLIAPTKPTKIVKDIMARQHVNALDMADALNMTPNAVRNRLVMDNISVDKLDEMLSELGYKILIVPSNTKLRNREYEVVPDRE